MRRSTTPITRVHAVEAALAMRRTLVDAERRLAGARAEAEERSFKPVRFGIGLNSGECCVGNLGSLRRFDYSAIGDEVNVASRLEGACKIFEVDIIGSETTRAEAPRFRLARDRFRPAQGQDPSRWSLCFGGRRRPRGNARNLRI